MHPLGRWVIVLNVTNEAEFQKSGTRLINIDGRYYWECNVKSEDNLRCMDSNSLFTSARISCFALEAPDNHRNTTVKLNACQCYHPWGMHSDGNESADAHFMIGNTACNLTNWRVQWFQA